MVSSLVYMVIAYLRTFCTCDHFLVRQFNENRDSNSIFIIFYLKGTIWFSCLKTWVDVTWVGGYRFFFPFNLKKEK